MDLQKVFEENKVAIIVGGVVVVGLLIFTVMGGGATGTVSDSATLDQSKKVESTVSKDTLGEGATKLGNIGSVGGNLDLSKRDSHNVNKGNE